MVGTAREYWRGWALGLAVRVTHVPEQGLVDWQESTVPWKSCRWRLKRSEEICVLRRLRTRTLSLVCASRAQPHGAMAVSYVALVSLWSLLLFSPGELPAVSSWTEETTQC